ncbi:MAG: O-antigen ligase family protein [Syntrophotaleaceae bacterium]
MNNAGYAAVWLLVFVIPLESSIFIMGVGTLGRVVGIFAMGVGLFFLLALKQEFRFHALLWFMLIFVLLNATSMFWTIAPENTYKRAFSYFQLLMMMWLILQWCDKENKVHGLYLAFVLGSLGLACGVLNQFLSGTMDERISAYNFNPNEIASILSLSIPFAWYLFLKKGPLRWLCLASIPAIGQAMLLTGSRAGLVKGLLGAAFIVLTPPKGMRRSWPFIVGGASLVILASVSVFLPEKTLDRLLTVQTELASGNLGGRGEIWSLGLEGFAHHPIWGVGAGSFSRTMSSYFPLAKAPHNVFISILVDLGLVGLIIFGIMTFIVARSVLKLKDIDLKLWIFVLSIWFSCIMTSNWEWRKQMWLIMILSVTHSLNAISKSKITINGYEDLNMAKRIQFKAIELN